MRIVDEPLPSHRGAGLLEVDPHDDEEVRGNPRRLLLQPLRVFNRGARIVDGAGPDDDEHPLVGPDQDAVDGLPGREDRRGHLLGGGYFTEDLLGRRELLDFPDTDVVDRLHHRAWADPVLRAPRPPDSAQSPQGLPERALGRIGALEPFPGARLDFGALGMAGEVALANLDRLEDPDAVAEIESRRLHLGSLLSLGIRDVRFGPAGRRVARIAQPGAGTPHLDAGRRAGAVAMCGIRVRIPFAEAALRVAGGGPDGGLGAGETAAEGSRGL